MKKNHIIAFGVLLLLLLASTAFAFGEIRYTDRPLNLRDGRSPKHAWIGNLYPGQKVRIAHLKDGWVAVYEPNASDGSESAAVGFANVKYLKKERTRHEPKEWGEMKYAIRALNVRSKPDIKGRKVKTLKSWEHVLVDFPEGDWILVFEPDATIRSKMNGIGYSSAKYFRTATEKTKASVGFGKTPEAVTPLTPEPAPEPIPVVAADNAEVVSGVGQVSGAVTPPPAQPKALNVPPRLVEATKKINVRLERTSASRLVRTLKSGDRVKVGLLENGWYAVFGEAERVHAESQPMGYALESIINKGTEALISRPKSVSKPEPAAVKPVPAPKPEPVAVKPQAAPKPEPTPVANPVVEKAQRTASAPAAKDSGKKTMVIDRTGFTKKRPDPTPDKSAHGYQYRFLEKSETRQFGEAWITLKVFLATTKLPNRQQLEDFATTLWKDHRRVTKNVAVLIYLPGMDTEDLAYGVIKFDDKRLLELWVRKATLFGTKFM